MNVSVTPRVNRAKWRAFAGSRITCAADRAAVIAATGLTHGAVGAWLSGKAACLPKHFPALAKLWGMSEAQMFAAAGLPHASLVDYESDVQGRIRARARERWKLNPRDQSRPLSELTPRGRKWRQHLKLSMPERVIALHLNADRSPYSKADLVVLALSWDFCCAYCGGKMSATSERTKDHATTDHIAPTSAGGPDILANIVPACYSCNSSKQGSDLLEWSARRGFVVHPKVLSQYKEIRSTIGSPSW